MREFPKVFFLEHVKCDFAINLKYNFCLFNIYYVPNS